MFALFHSNLGLLIGLNPNEANGRAPRTPRPPRVPLGARLLDVIPGLLVRFNITCETKTKKIINAL